MGSGASLQPGKPTLHPCRSAGQLQRKLFSTAPRNFLRLRPRSTYGTTSGTTYASTCRMYTRHVEGRPKIIKKIIALSKWYLPPCTPRHIWLLLIHRGPGWGSAALGSLCPFGFAPHYVAVQPGRCRRFIGTLLATIRYTARTLRTEQRTSRAEEEKALPLISKNKNLAGNNFEIDLAENIAMKVFRFLFFPVCNF